MPFLSAAYQPGRLGWFLLAGAVQALLIGGAVWAIQRSGPTRKTDHDSALLAAAALLITSWAVASIALNMGAPPRGPAWLATLPDQRVRYAALVLGSLISFGGVALLAARLHDAGQVVLSALGFASGIVAALLFALLFLVYPVVATSRYEQELVSGLPSAWWASFSACFSSALLVQWLSAHLSSILLALGLRKGGTLNRGATLGVIGLALAAVVARWFVHLPPALSLVPPYLLGVSLLASSRAPAS